MAYAAYLVEHVQTELTKAIAESTIQNPKDSVDFIGNYLLKIVEEDATTKKKNQVYAQWDKQDKELELRQKEQQLIAQQKGEETKMNQLKDEEFYAKIAECSNKIEAMNEWCKYIENKTKSSSVYIGSLCQIKQDDQDMNCILYNAVSTKENAFLLNTTFIQLETKGVVFDLLQSEETDDAKEEEENTEEDKDKDTDATKQRKMIHIDNVLLPNSYKDRLHYFTYQKVGSFLAFEASIKSYLNDEAIQSQLRPQWPRPIDEINAEEKLTEVTETEQKVKTEENENDTEQTEENKDDEEKEELPPDPPQTDVQYVICMDTLGGSEIYDADTLKVVDESIGKFEDILMKIDVNEYLKQREFEENLKTKLNEYQDKLKGEIDAKLAEIEQENESNPEALTLFKKKQYVIESTQCIWCLISNHCMKPQSSFCRIIAAFIKLFDTEQENRLSLINDKESQFDVISDAIWTECRNVLKDITSEKVSGYKVEEKESFNIGLFEALLNGIVVEEIGNEGIANIITILYEFVDSVCKLYKYTEEEKLKPEEVKEADAE